MAFERTRGDFRGNFWRQDISIVFCTGDKSWRCGLYCDYLLSGVVSSR